MTQKLRKTCVPLNMTLYSFQPADRNCNRTGNVFNLEVWNVSTYLPVIDLHWFQILSSFIHCMFIEYSMFQVLVGLKKLLMEGLTPPRAKAAVRWEKRGSESDTLALGTSRMPLVWTACVWFLTFWKAVQASHRKKCGKQRRARPGFLPLLVFCWPFPSLLSWNPTCSLFWPPWEACGSQFPYQELNPGPVSDSLES